MTMMHATAPKRQRDATRRVNSLWVREGLWSAFIACVCVCGDGDEGKSRKASGVEGRRRQRRSDPEDVEHGW